jgi:hypothetical protein
MLAPIEDAASRLRDRGIKRLPVVADGEAVVIVDSIPTVGPGSNPPVAPGEPRDTTPIRRRGRGDETDPSRLRISP